jgi:uncharacterized Fe-S cluster-containing radical SAM superfamily protein
MGFEGETMAPLDSASPPPAPQPAPAPKPTRRLAPEKFQDPKRTARGEARAQVALGALDTLWINTGTRCNIACANCFMESTPRNDTLAYISAAEVAAYLDEIVRDKLPTRSIGFTGGEPFLNRDCLAMIGDALDRGFEVLVLTNAMRPMQRHKAALLAQRAKHGERLRLRVSLDHHAAALHEAERGANTFQPTLNGLVWLARHGFSIDVAGRRFGAESEAELRQGYAALFARHGIGIDATDPVRLMLFPEMDSTRDVPEITEACWGILKKSPDSVMCASARMVVKRKGATGPAVVACTLLPFDPQFELGATLAEAARPVALNHPHCATFCVLGGAACSR